MFTLIKREIEDNIIFFLGAVISSITLIAISISIGYNRALNGPPVFSIGLGFLVGIVVIIGFCGMGASQMYGDRTRKISTLLSTLPATRSQILLARIITGILAILILLVPLAITGAILLRLFAPLYLIIYPRFVLEIFTAIFLMAFACYCLGLQTGWSSGKVPTLVSLVLTCVLVPLIIVKGFGTHTVIILLLFIAASLIRTWHKFMSTSL